MLLRHWSPQKEQLQREGSLCVLGDPPWSFPPPVPGREGWASVLSKSPSALYPPACPPPPCPGLGVAPEWIGPLLLFAGKSSGGEEAGSPTARLQSLDWLPGTLPQRGHTFCSHPVPFFCIWGNCVVINPEMDVFSTRLVPLSSGWEASQGVGPGKLDCPKPRGQRSGQVGAGGRASLKEARCGTLLVRAGENLGT